jgi:glucose-1-phosphate thymidylyltransferase
MIDQAIVMAGGSSTRLSPNRVNKHLLPVYDKPMIYYPLSTLMLAGVSKFCLVCDPDSLAGYKRLLGKGERFGISIEYVIQEEPKGIADGLIRCAKHLERRPFAMILGDNIFHGHGFTEDITRAFNAIEGPEWPNHWPDGFIFTKQVADPRRYGVATISGVGHVTEIVEKPKHPKSNDAVTGLYVYQHSVIEVAFNLEPSKRGELEITDLNNKLIDKNKLFNSEIGRGIAWLDTGTPQALLQAAEYIAAIQERQGTVVACLEEIAINQGWLKPEDLGSLPLHNTTYDNYVRRLLTCK